jgi:ABC-type branched-subunit amino acid transport system substrate-binding protein
VVTNCSVGKYKKGNLQMTEQLDTGVNVGSENQVDSNAGNEKVADSKPTVEELQSLLEQERKAGASKDKSYSEVKAQLKALEEEREKERQARLTDEEKTKERLEYLEKRERDYNLTQSLTSKGLNAVDIKKAIAKYDAGDFDGYAEIIADSIQSTVNAVKQKTEEEIKSSIKTSTAPAVKDSNGSEDVLKSMGLL